MNLEMAQQTRSNPYGDPLIAEIAKAFHNDHCNHRSEEAMGYHREYRICEVRAAMAIVALRALPVEQRMTAMGARRVDTGCYSDVWYREPFTPVEHDDARTYWTVDPWVEATDV